MLEHDKKIANVLNRMYDIHAVRYKHNHPGCSENDIERAFLHQVLLKVVGVQHVEFDALSILIDSIR